MNKEICSNLWFMLRQIARYTPGLLCTAIVEGIVWGVIHSITSVIYLRIIFNQIERMAPFNEILKTIGLLTVFLIVVFNLLRVVVYEFRYRGRAPVGIDFCGVVL